MDNQPIGPPVSELAKLLLTMASAVDEAVDGHLAAGYTVLLLGLHRAQRMWAAGEPGAKDLVWRYHKALENYSRTYGVHLE